MRATRAVILAQLLWAGAASAQSVNFDGQGGPATGIALPSGLFGQFTTKPAPGVPAIGNVVAAPGGDEKAAEPEKKGRMIHWLRMKCADDDGEKGVDPTPAAPPLLGGVDDADTPGCKTWEINVHSIRDRAAGSTQWQAPFLDANYGVGQYGQLKFEIPMVWLQQREVPGGYQKDLGNATVGFKYQFLTVEKTGTAVAVYPQLSFVPPGAKSGDRHLDSNTPTFTSLIIVDQDLGKIKGHEMVAVGNYAYNSALGHESDSHFVSGGLGMKLTDRVALMGDVDSTRNTSFSEDGIKEHQVMGRFGTMIRVAEWLNAYAAAGHTIGGNMPPHTVVMAGAQFIFNSKERPDPKDGIGLNFRTPRLGKK